MHGGWVSSLLLGYRQKQRSQVVLLSSTLSSSSLPATSLFTYSIPSSISSMSPHYSRVQLPSTAITIQVCNGLTLLILLYLAISYNGLDLIVTLL